MSAALARVAGTIAKHHGENVERRSGEGKDCTSERDHLRNARTLLPAIAKSNESMSKPNKLNFGCCVKHFKELRLPVPVMVYSRMHHHSSCRHINNHTLPMVSIAFAARNTIRRQASISIRAFAITSGFLPRRTMGFPNASRVSPRRTISSRARSPAPIERMQW